MDPVTGELYEIVWSGDMGRPITGDRLTKPNPIFDTPATERRQPLKRLYNKTGLYAKDPDFWKLRTTEGENEQSSSDESSMHLS